jgi:hypothetical protein
MGIKTNYSPTFPMYPAGAVSATLSDTTNLRNPSVVFVGGVAGNVKVTTANGDEIVFGNVQAGAILPVQVVRVWSTGTTATGLVTIY